MTKLLRSPALLCLSLGALAACGFAPLGLWPLTIACVGAWMLLVGRARSIHAALGRGYAFGVGHFTINNNWFQHAFDFQDKMPPVLGYAAAVALALYLAVYPAMAAGAAWRFRNERRSDLPFVLAFAAAWIATEWLRATVFTGYAWDPLAVVWVPVQPVAALAAWVGTYALSGLTVVVAGLAAIAFIARRLIAIGTMVGLLLAALAAQAFSYLPGSTGTVPADAPRLVVVQPNVGQEQRGTDREAVIQQKLIDLSGDPGVAPRLVLWPEGIVDRPIEDGYPAWFYAGSSPNLTRLELLRRLGPRDILVTGGTAYHFDPQRKLDSAANSVFAMTSDARILGRYDKAHLVPYGEYLPIPWLLKPLGLARLVPGDLDFDPGPGPRALTLPGFGAIGVQICYEIVFSGQVVDRAHRPRLLFNPSNDAWFGTWGAPQHLAQARMRAIEEGLPIVRATPTGISAIIAADGRLIATVPHETAGAIEAPIPPALPSTLFARLGNLLAALTGTALFVAAIAIRRRHR